LNDDQIFDALDGQSDLSPKAVIARAGERKEKDKAQAAKITSGLLAVELDIDTSPLSSGAPSPVTTEFDFNGDPGPAMSDESPAKDPNPMDDFTSLTTPETEPEKTGPETEPEKTGGKETTSPTGFKDEGKGPLGSLFSDVKSFFAEHGEKAKAARVEFEKKGKAEALSRYGKGLASLDIEQAEAEEDYGSASSQTEALNARNRIQVISATKSDLYKKIINAHEDGRFDASSLFKSNPELHRVWQAHKAKQESKQTAASYEEKRKPGAPL
jgi:hypothetical protein